DDTAAAFVGQWKDSKLSSQRFGAGYRHDEKTGKGEKSVSWTPELPHAGEYDVQLSFASGNGRDTAGPRVVRHAHGGRALKVDQTKSPQIDKLFHSLGRFKFEKGKAGSVTMSNAGTTEYVIADAVRFVPVSDDPAGADAAGSEVAEKKKAERERLDKVIA